MDERPTEQYSHDSDIGGLDKQIEEVEETIIITAAGRM